MGQRVNHPRTDQKQGRKGEKPRRPRDCWSRRCWLVFSTDNVANRIDTSDEIGQIPEYGSFLWREQRERRSEKPVILGSGYWT